MLTTPYRASATELAKYLTALVELHLLGLAKASDQDFTPTAKEALDTRPGSVFLCLRAAGKWLGETWVDGADQRGALIEGLQRLRKKLEGRHGMATTLEVCLCESPRLVDSHSDQAWTAVNANAARGVVGLELRYGEIRQRTSPTSMISTNRDAERLMELFVEKHAIPVESVRSRVKVSTFAADQYLVLLSKPIRTQPLVRGSRLVLDTDVTAAEVRRLQDSLAEFLLNNVHPDGRMIYAYFPSRGEEDAQHNNMIRQFMASFALCQLARDQNEPRISEIVRSNLKFNLDHFYRTDPGEPRDGIESSGELGLIEYRGHIKLGAVALAALTLMVHPARGQYAAVEASLWRTIDFLWRESGEFRTFYEPSERNDMQNFYPGEALLAWAHRYRETRDTDLERRFMRSFRFYRSYHREPHNRNPAFIPWHTQAYYVMWQQTGAPELADFILEMNDWLLPVQQWPVNRHPEFAGRFYDPKRPFGPPHASSTGVYLEGLADAYALARALKDLDRAERYRLAICRGIRSLSQLTFRDEIDMFYVHQRARLKGGVRTTCYNNVVRVDNVQHSFLALRKISGLLGPSEVSCVSLRTKPAGSIVAEGPIAVLETETLLGANLFVDQTAVSAKLRLAQMLASPSETRFAEAARKLGATIPTFEPIFESTRLDGPSKSPASVACLVASVAAALQGHAGCPEQPFFEEASESGLVLALTSSQYPELSQRALVSATALVGSVLADADVSQASLARQVNSFMSFATGWLPSPERRALASVARARRIPCELVSSKPPIYRLGQGRFQVLCNLTTTSHTSAVHAQFTSNKPLANRVFRQLGVPMARQLLAKSADEAASAAEQLGYPVVTKPWRGSGGRGVSANLHAPEQVRTGYARASKVFGEQVAVEEFLPGDDYRLLFVSGEFIAGAKRLPPSVVGDGQHSVSELVRKINAQRERENGFPLTLAPYKLDEEALRMLGTVGYDADSVPPVGRVVELRSAANGGTTRDVTGRLHPDNIAAAAHAARVAGIDVCGVDFLLPDPTRSFRETGGGICEVNYHPSLLLHIIADGGSSLDVVEKFVTRLLQQTSVEAGVSSRGVSAQSDACITLVLLLNSPNSLGDGVAELLDTGTARVGADGVYLDGSLVVQPVPSWPDALAVALFDRGTRRAVADVRSQDILQRGLGVGRCQLAVFYNATDVLEPAGQVLFKAADTRLVWLDDDATHPSWLNQDWRPGELILCGSCRGRVNFDGLPDNVRRIVIDNEGLLVAYDGAKRQRLSPRTSAPSSRQMALTVAVLWASGKSLDESALTAVVR